MKGPERAEHPIPRGLLRVAARGHAFPRHARVPEKAEAMILDRARADQSTLIRDPGAEAGPSRNIDVTFPAAELQQLGKPALPEDLVGIRPPTHVTDRSIGEIP
jgi:hypothetical protein